MDDKGAKGEREKKTINKKVTPDGVTGKWRSIGLVPESKRRTTFSALYAFRNGACFPSNL